MTRQQPRWGQKPHDVQAVIGDAEDAADPWDDDPFEFAGEWSPGAETLTMADFTVGPREIWCGKCSLIHRPEIECA